MKRWIFLMMVSVAGAETVTLKAVLATDVYSYPGDGAPTSTIYTLGVNSTPPSYETLHSQKSLIRFNLSSLPFSASEIGSAVLRVFVIQPDPTYGGLSPGDVYVRRQAVAWSLSPTPRWSTFQSAEELGSFYVATNSLETWVQHDVTSTAVGWAAGTYPNYGLFLAPFTDRLSPSLNVTFASYNFPGYEPQLVITRKVVPPVLSIATAPGGVTVRWPVAGSTGWVLQKADSPGGTWTDHMTTVNTVGAEKVLQEALGTRAFFRLRN